MQFKPTYIRSAVVGALYWILTTEFVSKSIEKAIGWIAPSVVERRTSADTWPITFAKASLAVVSFQLIDNFAISKLFGETKSEEEEEEVEE